ncbi:YhfG family protein [Pseudomonas sp. RIT-To-2]|uniref:YhfG family protein n=1 Tax=Pseudomonas sp. RIT-To-2 TaxID=3462541 RepID=UPI00241310C5
MQPTSFQAKKAYYAKVRRSNYLASLRLAGFDTTKADLQVPLPSKEEILKKFRGDACSPADRIPLRR